MNSIQPLLILLFCTIGINALGQRCEGNCSNGYGTGYFGSGVRYEGQWKKENLEGQVILYYTDGRRYGKIGVKS